MPVSERVSKIIWGQCAARCCICKTELLRERNGKVASLLGEVAHIIGETLEAARGKCHLTSSKRNEPDNLLLLCRDHHKIVDDDPATYPIHRLRQFKDEHISWVTASLVKTRPWRSTISQLAYINVPRLCEQAELQGYHVDLSRYAPSQTLHSLGWELNHVMAAFQTVLPHLSIDAVTLSDVRLHEGFIGTPISFDRQRFRTKNLSFDPHATLQTIPNFTGDLAKDPHIYARLTNCRVVLFIDQRWVTTSTAFTLFRPPSGQSTFSGLGRVTNVDYEACIVTATPWVIGLPKGPFEELLKVGSESGSRATSATTSLDELVDLDRAHKHNVHFSPPPTHCDLCRKTLANEKYMIDGAVKGLGAWACMCAACFAERGQRIAWGAGQLYQRDKDGWLEVAGFSPEEE
jgi:HNH endonuclease